MSFSFRRLSLIVSFLLWSLHSFYSYNLGLPLIATLSGIFIFSLFYIDNAINPRITINSIQLTIIYFYLIMLTWSVLDLIIVQDYPDIKRILFINLSILYLFGIKHLLDEVRLRDLLKYYLYFHTFFLYLQVCVFYLFDYHLDFLFYLTGVGQSISGGSFSTDFIRPTGLYNEPGTYSNFIAPVLMLFSRYYEFSRENRLLFWVALISIVITFSTFGLIFSLIILLSIPSVKIKIKLLSIFLFTGFTAPYFTYRFIDRAAKGYNDGTEIREEFIINIFNYVIGNLHGLFFGSGNMISNEYYINYTMPDNDAGLIVYLIHSNGPIFTIFVLSYVFLRSRPIDIFSSVSFIIILLGKISLFSPFAPALLYLIFCRERPKCG